MSSILTKFAKALPLVAVSLSIIGSPIKAQAQEWERFFVRLDTDKLSVGLDGTATLKSGAEGLWFNSDGRYVKTATGVATVGGFDAYCSESPQSCGRYEVSGDRYTLYSTSNPNEVRDTFVYSDRPEPTIGNENHTYFFVPPAASTGGFFFDGNLRSVNNVNSGSTYSFDKSGRFSIKNPNTSEVETGTYDVKEYALILNYDHGEIERRPFYLAENRLYIDGQWFQFID